MLDHGGETNVGLDASFLRETKSHLGSTYLIGAEDSFVLLFGGLSIGVDNIDLSIGFFLAVFGFLGGLHIDGSLFGPSFLFALLSFDLFLSLLVISFDSLGSFLLNFFGLSLLELLADDSLLDGLF